MFSAGCFSGVIRCRLRRFISPNTHGRHLGRSYSSTPNTNCEEKAAVDAAVDFEPGEGDADIKSGYSVSQTDFKWVERLFPPSRVPQPPKHENYPTPSGWIAPSVTPPDKPYFVARSRFHSLPVYEVRRPSQTQRWITVIRNVEGDIKALEKELVELLRPYSKYDPATRVHELTQTIWVKGLHKEKVEDYLYTLGF